MKKLLIAATVILGLSSALAQDITNHSVPVGGGPGAVGWRNVGPCAALQSLQWPGSTSDPVCATLSGSILTATASGTFNTLALVTSPPISALTDGMMISFASPITATSISEFATITSIAGVAGGPWNIRGQDGYTLVYQYDMLLNQNVFIRWNAALGVFTLMNSHPVATNFGGTGFTHGMYKLQAASASTLNLNGNDGSGILYWNSTTGGYHMGRFGPGGQCSQNLFNATAIVEGVAGQTLANNTIYSVYLEPQAASADPGINPATNACMSFWRLTSGFGPTINSYGMFVLNNITLDPTRVYLGMIYTDTADISNHIGPAASMSLGVYSHSDLSRWRFGYQTTVVNNPSWTGTGIGNFATQATPIISAPTEGVSESPQYVAAADVSCTTGGTSVAMRLKISGTAFSGAPFTSTTPAATAQVVTASSKVHLTAEYDSAPPMGWYQAQIELAADNGIVCAADMNILGHLSQ